MSDLPPNGLSATEAADKLRTGALTSEELVTACLNRIEQTDSQVKAWVHLDREYALMQARELDQIRQNGKPMGPLHGIPVGLKDIVDTSFYPTEYGSPIFKGHKSDRDALVVQRLKEAGAVILGKTATAEFAFVNPAETRNPHNPDHTPGGSSSGSAAAVAAFHVPFAIGTQTNGSVIRPASFCGTYGFKPTMGVVSRSGFLQTSRTLDQVGVFARSVEDAALLVDAISCYDPTDHDSYSRARPNMANGAASQPPVEPQFAWLEMPYSDLYTKDMQEGFEEVIDALGKQIERITPADTFAGLIETHRVIHEYEFCRHLSDTIEKNWKDISPKLKLNIEQGREISTETYEHALVARKQTQSFFEDFFKDYDAILTPTATGEAPLFSEGNTGNPVCCTIWTLAGLPCVSLPILVGEKGLPIGIQLVGASEEDDRLLRTANWVLKQLQ
ncbi:MAG: amidase [Rhizobiaceae bacterium]